MLDKTKPHVTVMTPCLAFNGLIFVPHYEREDLYVGPGGVNIIGAYLRALGAITQHLMLWPR